MKQEILVVTGVLAGVIAASHFMFGLSPTELWAANSPQSATTQQVVSGPPANDEGYYPRVASSDSVPANDRADNHNHLIAAAAASLANSPPLEARLRFKINLFDEEISGPGRYYQKGQGTRLSRIEFEFGFHQSGVQLHQFCDGQMLYNLTIAGEKQNLEYVDLRELDGLQQSVASSSRVASWLSVGSLTGLMEQLATHFDFTEIEEVQLDSIPAIRCTGQWRAPALARLLEGQIEADAVRDDIVRWQQLPRQLPHQVRLTLGKDDRFPWFPYRIVFEQYTLQDEELVVREIAVLELYELRHAPHLTDEMFLIPDIDAPPRESTEFYRKRILQFTR
ncbi:MAG: hypothetical protein ACR2NP_12755 [Pirellulaceae bacterium]